MPLTTQLNVILYLLHLEDVNEGFCAFVGSRLHYRKSKDSLFYLPLVTLDYKPSYDVSMCVINNVKRRQHLLYM